MPIHAAVSPEPLATAPPSPGGLTLVPALELQSAARKSIAKKSGFIVR